MTIQLQFFPIGIFAKADPRAVSPCPALGVPADPDCHVPQPGYGEKWRLRNLLYDKERRHDLVLVLRIDVVSIREIKYIMHNIL